MRVFVAGASGAIGRRLVPQLIAAGHEVAAMCRTEEGAEVIRAAGAEAFVCNVFDRPAVNEAVASAGPEVVINQMTKLPQRYNPRRIDYEPTNRVRVEGGRNLIAAATAAGARRLIIQSIAFLYAPEGDPIKDEEARPFTDAPGGFRTGIEAILTAERDALEATGFDALVLRYGWFYGPGTYYAPGGSQYEDVRRRRFPIVGRGGGIFSFIHIDDAAGATVAAVEGGAPGIYNIVDDDPAPLREWLPAYAAAIGAKRPLRVPAWLARLVAGPFANTMAIELRGASNAKVKRELGWQPRYPSWRQGFREGLE
jgi:nucleoside-diphosphate-sugar epimerase